MEKCNLILRIQFVFSCSPFCLSYKLLGITHSLNNCCHLKKQTQMRMSTELHCYFISVFSHNILSLFCLSVHNFSLPQAVLKVCACVLKQSAVPSGNFLTFISWIYNKTLGDPCWYFHVELHVACV